MRRDIDSSTRVIGMLMVGALAAIIAAIVLISRTLNEHDDTVQFALLLGAYLVALIPLSVQHVVQRVFYAFHDTRSPFFANAVQAALVITTAVLSFWLLPLEFLAIGIALGQSLSNYVQLLVSVLMLRKHMGHVGLGPAVTRIGFFVVAALPATAIGWVTYLLMGGLSGWFTSDRLPALIGLVIVGGVTGAAYAATLAVLRATEFGVVLRVLRGYLPGRR